jgi:putative addiction module component (TIGR02574 family)
MISAIQDESVKTLRELFELHPGARIGQLFALLGELADDQFGKSLWDIEDEDMFTLLRRHREELRNSVAASQQIVDEPLTPAEIAELERRLALSEADPNRGIPMEVVFEEARKRRGR